MSARGLPGLRGNGLPGRALLWAAAFLVPCAPVAGETPAGGEKEKKGTPTERVRVSETHGGDLEAPTGMASTVVEPEEVPGLAGAVASLAASVAGVSENGQGGLFQSVSIRGTARQRILQMVDGMRITDERRAGPATSFLDPGLIGSVDVLRGPASSYYGSGALGGVLQVFPRWFDGVSASAGYLSQGDGSALRAAWGGKHLSAGVVRRTAGDGETAAGERRNSGFRQVSATVGGRWSDARRDYRLLWVPSLAEDIGKPNTDFPGRTTVYPEERHHLVRFGVEDSGSWEASAWMHPHSLDTEVAGSDGSRAEVRSDSLDLGARWMREQAPGRLRVRWGFDSFHRRSVDSEETQLDPTGASSTARTLDDAGADELGGFATVRGSWGRADWEAGGRLTWIEQRNDGFEDIDDAAATGFFGATVPLAGRLRFLGHVGTGLRFPTLTERFFSGTTGRGTVAGNPDLEPERSVNLEAGLTWLGRRLTLSGSLFHNEIDRFIERVETAPDELTFVNLRSGRIRGVELEGVFRPDGGWHLSWGGHMMEGRDREDRPLADVPPDEVHAGGGYARERWGLDARLAWRAGKADPGSGEKEIGSATLLAASVRWQIAAGWSLQVRGDNLLDEDHFPAADRKAQEAPGRSFGAFVTWSER